MRIESAEYLQRVYEAIWHALGARGEEAEIYARCFVRADLLGKETQGIACVPLVYPWIRAGAIRFGRSLTTVREGPSFALVDGNSGPGQVCATRAMEIALEKARESGVACVWVRNSNDFTMATNYAEMALEHDCFGLAMSNGVPLVAAWGGREPVFNTNPMSFAVPAGDERPIIFDGATSAVSHGHVVLAARDGRIMAGSPLVGADGQATGNAAPLITDPFDRNSEQLGAILPLGAKGFGWLILVEVLSSLMAGGGLAADIPFDQSAEDPWTGGFFLMAVDIGALVDIDRFKAQVDRLVRSCRTLATGGRFQRDRDAGGAGTARGRTPAGGGNTLAGRGLGQRGAHRRRSGGGPRGASRRIMSAASGCVVTGLSAPLRPAARGPCRSVATG